MKVKDQKGRELEIESVTGTDGDDIQIDEIYYTDDPEEVSDEVVEFVSTTYATELYEFWYEWMVGRAEYIAEMNLDQ